MRRMTDINDHVQRQFGTAADRYRTSSVHAQGHDLALMRAAADLTGGEIILDAGCGAGHTALTFAPHVDHVVAYDLTSAMLVQVERLAAERGVTNIETRQGSVEQLPFADASFDRVVSRYSAHHWGRPLQALNEFRRVLKPGGLLVLSDIVAPEDPAHDTFLQTIELLRDPSHVRDHRLSEWDALFRHAGFAPEVIARWELPLEFDSWVTRMATPELNVTMIKRLFDDAPDSIRQAMQLGNDYLFCIPGAIVKGYTAPA
jgi:ubiquinone/menaquinone biosynthesis C-methylase UbiE